MKPLGALLVLAIGALILAGIAGGQPAQPAAPATPAACEYTYENFGAKFLAAHCTECHSTTSTGWFSRKGAPKSVNFDDPKAIAAKKAAMIYRTVTDKSMPPWFAASNKPEKEDAAKFKAWLECEYK
jgi:uncharacterized membrane protein